MTDYDHLTIEDIDDMQEAEAAGRAITVTRLPDSLLSQLREALAEIRRLSAAPATAQPSQATWDQLLDIYRAIRAGEMSIDDAADDFDDVMARAVGDKP